MGWTAALTSALPWRPLGGTWLASACSFARSVAAICEARRARCRIGATLEPLGVACWSGLGRTTGRGPVVWTCGPATGIAYAAAGLPSFWKPAAARGHTVPRLPALRMVAIARALAMTVLRTATRMTPPVIEDLPSRLIWRRMSRCSVERPTGANGSVTDDEQPLGRSAQAALQRENRVLNPLRVAR